MGAAVAGHHPPAKLAHQQPADRQTTGAERSSLHQVQPVEAVVEIQLIQSASDDRRADDIGLPQTIRVLVVAILIAVNVSRRRSRAVLPALVDDAVENVQAVENATGSALKVQPYRRLRIVDRDDHWPKYTDTASWNVI